VISLLIRTSGPIVTLSEPHHLPKRRESLGQLDVLAGGFLGLDRFAGKITYVSSQAPATTLMNAEVIELDAGDRVVMPGFVDCHNHLIWAGSRAGEFFARCQGKSYQDIAAEGGGIAYTREQTLRASEDELLAVGRRNLRELVRHGVTTLEGKSGYALTTEGELRMLRVLRRLKDEFAGTLVSTYLGAHIIPPEKKSHRQKYVAEAVAALTPIREQRLAEFCDVFVDEQAFTLAEAELVLRAASDAGFRLRLHADQFSDAGAADLAMKLRAVSVDHLDAIGEETARRLAASDTVCVLLPGAAFFSRSPLRPPARLLIESGAVVALATDLNPGSSHIFDPSLIMTLASLELGIGAEEGIAAFTKNAAFALSRGYTKGSLAPGFDADVLVLATDDYRDLAYGVGADLVDTVIAGGGILKEKGVMKESLAPNQEQAAGSARSDEIIRF